MGGEVALTDEGRSTVEALAHHHGVAPEAVVVLLRALQRGGGDQAQFTHADLGGMGQWSRHGMIMVGDMFNDALKARVDQLCRETAGLLGRPELFQADRRGAPSDVGAWWPEDCGRPSASGSQNDMRYACFPETRRLAIGHGDRVDLYDTGEHRIHGVSQQQGGDRDLKFTSQLGTVALHSLKRVSQDEAASREPASDRPPDPGPRPATPVAGLPDPARPAGSEVLATLERLHELQRKGVLSEAEFAEKKKELLARI